MKTHSFRYDQSGATALFFAISVIPLLAAAGLAIDVGNIFSAKRRLQGATDLAALAAASNLSNANALAQVNASVNGYLGSEITKLELGTYDVDPNVAPGARFQPGSSPAPNAVRVTMVHQQPLFFGPVFALVAGGNTAVQNVEEISTQGIASISNVANFSIGSTTASFNGGIVNGVLGALLGGEVSLSAAQYTALASTNVDMFAFAKVLSLQAGQVGGTYKQAFSGAISLQAFLSALSQVAPTTAPALSELNLAASNSGQTVTLGALADFGPYDNMSLSDPEPDLPVSASVLELVQAAAELGAPSHLISLSLASGIPGIASATGLLSLGEPAQGSTAVAVGPTGSTVHTAQLRLYLDISLAGTGSIPLVNLPIYLELGYGTASLSSLTCTAFNASTTSATLAVTPGLVNAWLGSVTAAQVENYSSEPAVAPAVFLNLGSVTVTGQANAQIANISPTQISFSYNDVQNKTVRTTSTTDLTASLYSSLLTNTSYKVSGVGLPGVQPSVAAILAGAAAPVDQLLTDVLQTLGVDVGQADTWINGTRCGAPVLSG